MGTCKIGIILTWANLHIELYSYFCWEVYILFGHDTSVERNVGGQGVFSLQCKNGKVLSAGHLRLKVWKILGSTMTSIERKLQM